MHTPPLNPPSSQAPTRLRAPSVWSRPRLSLRWWPVFLRNLLVWKKLAIPSLVGNIAEPLMWLVAFGYGIHRCLGQQLARIELHVVFEKLFKRFPNLQVAEPVQSLPFKYDSQIYGLYRLPVTW